MFIRLLLLLPQYKVRTLQDLVSLKDSDRRSMLRVLGEEKYDEVMAVLGSFPHITMDTKLQGRFRHSLLNLLVAIVCLRQPSKLTFKNINPQINLPFFGDVASTSWLFDVNDLYDGTACFFPQV